MTLRRIMKQRPGLTGLILGVLLFCCGSPGAGIPARTAEGFAIPQPNRHFTFPRDHGSHPEFGIEWWYVTGHLFTQKKKAFGFQATFFRRALVPGGTTPNSAEPAFGSDAVYLAHVALVDQATGIFRYQERLNRSGWDAAAATDTLDVHNGNWQLRLAQPESAQKGSEVFELHYSIGADIAVHLNLSPTKPLVVFGRNGVSQKGAEPEASSHYLTYSRLSASGVITGDGNVRRVNGEAWMDHEFSSSQLGAGQVGWDWLSLQLFDGREMMAYRMRRSNGSTDPFSTVAWIDINGIVRQMGPSDFRWMVREWWRSPATGTQYPSAVELVAKDPVTGRWETFRVQPVVADQELAGKIGGVAYWEGACGVRDESGQEIGRAYMELTGYGDSLRGKF